MSIKLQQLKHFVMVVEEGGFRAASHRANRSQAALSTSIKELEKNLGQTLFETGNKSKLTPFGEICLPKIIQFLNRIIHFIGPIFIVVSIDGIFFIKKKIIKSLYVVF